MVCGESRQRPPHTGSDEEWAASPDHAGAHREPKTSSGASVEAWYNITLQMFAENGVPTTAVKQLKYKTLKRKLFGLDTTNGLLMRFPWQLQIRPQHLIDTFERPKRHLTS